jgi:predicted XRE-type DNA-binding protein
MMEITRGSDNVFADLGLPDADEWLAKARMAHHIAGLIEQAGWTQAEAARRMGLTQPNVSDLVRGKLRGFSLDRLVQCLNALGQDVEIVIRPKSPKIDRGCLHVAAPSLK